MWLEGSEENTFRKFPGEEQCFICYEFLIEEDIGSINFNDLATSMDEPFFIADASDKCDDSRGGFWRSNCDEDEEPVNSKKNKKGETCCVQKNILNHCEDRGGKCFTPTDDQKTPEGFPYTNNKWTCSGNQKCFAKGDNRYTYTRYITEFGRLGGDIYFIPPTEADKDLDLLKYTSNQLYAISFGSSSKTCEGWKCKLGAFFGFGPDPGKAIVEQIPFADTALRKLREETDFIHTESKPSFIIVSSYDHAKNDLGCKVG